MDAMTRARYQAWVKRRIFKRVVIPGVLLLVVLIGVTWGLRWLGNREDVEEDDATSCLQEPCPEGLTTEPADERLEQPVMSRQPTYQDFNFSIYNEAAIVEVGAQYLNSYLVLVNKVFRLPEDFSPRDLVVPEVLATWGHDNTNHQMRQVAASALEALFNAAYEEAGLTLWAFSGYRSFEEQAYAHQYCLSTHGCDEGEKRSARPGHSEHQTGLTMDITAASVGGILTQELSKTPEGIWVAENAHRFGFIIRYPEGKTHLTGIIFEPWHIRYVGREAATYIFENDLVLEQYIFPLPQWEQP